MTVDQLHPELLTVVYLSQSVVMMRQGVNQERDVFYDLDIISSICPSAAAGEGFMRVLQ